MAYVNSAKAWFVKVNQVLRNHSVFTAGFIAVAGVQFFGAMVGDGFQGSCFNKIIHFLMPFFGAPLLYLAIARVSLQRLISSTSGIIFFTFLFGAAAVVLWEVVEFIADPWVTFLLQYDNRDTMLDIIAGLCGSVFGGIFLALSYRKR